MSIQVDIKHILIIWYLDFDCIVLSNSFPSCSIDSLERSASTGKTIAHAWKQSLCWARTIAANEPESSFTLSIPLTIILNELWRHYLIWFCFTFYFSFLFYQNYIKWLVRETPPVMPLKFSRSPLQALRKSIVVFVRYYS